MSEYSQPFPVASEPGFLSGSLAIGKRVSDFLFVLSRAITISIRCQSELNWHGRIGQKTQDEIKAEVNSWP